jgi:dihydrofolate reductase
VSDPAAPLVIVVAHDRRRAIGRGNALPWHLPDDLKRFKAMTLGHPVLMGRRTAEAIGRALPGRENLVLTRSGRTPFPGQVAVASLDEARARTAGDLYVIGGAEVYALALPATTRIELTLVDIEVTDADAWFPELPAGRFVETARTSHPADARHAHAFDFVTLDAR